MPRHLLTFALVLIALLPRTAAAQEVHYTLAFRGVPLDEALTRFAEATSTALAYDPHLVDGHRAYCIAEEAPVDELLACLLDVSGLDYYRLSSGTYVLAEPSEAEALSGHLVGVVTDRSSGTPLPGAHVYLAEAGRGAVANEAGRFVVPDVLPGRHAVQVSYLGYVTWRDTLYVAAEAPTQAKAALDPETVLVTPVVVDGMRQRLASEALGSGRAGGEQSLAGQPDAGAFEALVARPGMRGSVFDGLYVQGSDAGGHALRLDGVPVYQPQLPGLVSPFAASALERVTVEKAGFDAALGSQTAAVLRAAHALGSTPGLDVQVDPLALDGRVQAALGEAPERQLAVMTGARIGLWGLATPPALRDALAAWSRPDLFLLSADRPGVYAAAARADDEPRSMHYADVHAAARLRMGPLRTLYASGYVGQRALGGTHGAFSGPEAQQRDVHSVALVTAQDQYDWQNRLAQVRYDAVLGRRTLAGLQARASTYTLVHDYRIVDSLTVDADTGWPVAHRTERVSDGNGITNLALEGTLDHARGDHQGQVTAELTWTDASFDLYGAQFADGARGVPAVGEFADVSALRHSVAHAAFGWRLALAATDRWRLREGLHLEGGVRLTYLPGRRTVYAEPRLALRLDGSSPLGAWAVRTAAGLYRQYEGRYRTSVLDVGALLPTLDVWLPVDGSVRPPAAYHLAQDLMLRPLARFTVHVETYYKHQPHQLVLRYAGAGDQEQVGLVRHQRSFLAGASGYAWGAAATVAWQGEHLRTEASYERSEAHRRSPGQFEGRVVPVPWNEPHRAMLGLDAYLTSRLSLSTRARAVWGRTWGFRRTYYDYFGHDTATRVHGAFDLGHPEHHALPPLYVLDAGLAYTRALGPADLQLRLDVRNVLDRQNVLDRRLVQDGDAYRSEPRYLPARMPVVVLRLVL